ncbi:MAG: tetratricopeptide repeat protein [Planctomycetia bacterium]|nr:tetratricopeptide repeat protein [Planctomycetia bacterium]
MVRAALKITRKKLLAGLAVAGALVCVYFAPHARAAYCRYRGTRALKAQNDTLALDWFESAEKLSPENGRTQFLMARACRRLSQFDDMNRRLERAAALGFSPRGIERERWLAIAQVGRTAELGNRLQTLLDNPGDDGPEICAALATGFELTFDVESAGLVLDTWTAKYPDDADGHWRTGRLKFSLTDWAGAAAAFRRCLEHAPDRTSVRLNLAQSLVRMNSPAEAEPHFRRCLKEQPGNLEARVGLGTCLVNLGRSDEARTVLREALQAAPHDFEAARILGELELSLGNAASALECLAPLAKAWPRDKLLCTLMARALHDSGREEEAKAYRDEAERAAAALEKVDPLLERIKQDSADLDARYELGTLLLERRSREEGAGWLQSVVRLSPRHPQAHAALAEFYERWGSEDLAQMHRRLAESSKDQGHAE